MLTMVKDKIQNVTKDSFDVYFKDYIMSIQDTDLDMELNRLKTMNTLNTCSLIQLVNNTLFGGDDV